MYFKMNSNGMFRIIKELQSPILNDGSENRKKKKEMRATIKGHEANGAISLEFIFIRKYCTHPRKKGGKEKEPEPCREIANTRTTPWHFDTRRVFFLPFLVVVAGMVT